MESQRRVGKRFVDHVMELTESARVRQAMAFIGSKEPTVEEDVAEAYKMAKSAAIDSYTLCGNEGDWRRQAGHFVAAAAAACLAPGAQSGLAWSTAMNARMARVCNNIADCTGADESEAKEQYRILASFLDAA